MLNFINMNKRFKMGKKFIFFIKLPSYFCTQTTEIHLLRPYTRLEIDEYEMQNGREYHNYPQSQYNNIQKATITQSNLKKQKKTNTILFKFYLF